MPRFALPLLALSLLIGCGHSDVPVAVWQPGENGPAAMVYPRAITYSPVNDEFFIVDRLAIVQRLDRHGRFLDQWQMPEWENGKPTGLSAGPDGLLYVADTHYHRVAVYKPGGTFVRDWGRNGTGPGEFIFPTDVAFGRDGKVFVSEYGDNDRIQVFDAAGQFLYQFGRFGSGDGEFSRPQSLLVQDDLLFVADACNHRILVFTTDGKYLRAMGKVGSAPGEFRYPYGLDADPDGNLIVCEFGNNRVQRIDARTGQSLASWGRPGRSHGELAYPWAAAVDKRGRIAVADSGNNRIQVFR